MGIPFGSEAWASALEDEINQSSEYKNAGSAWGNGFNGNLLFVFEADDQMSPTKALFLQLANGSCQGANFQAEDSHPDAGFELRAPFSLWKQILERKTMAATAILTGRMKVEGDKMTLLKHTSASRSLIHCVASIETEWPA